MSRLKALMAALGLAIGGVGCAQCDTCDDFPAPCTGPNCGGYAAPAPAAYGTTVPAGSTAPAAGPASLGTPADGAGPAPSAPAVNPAIESKPAGDAGSPPRPTETPIRLRTGS